jgi:small subunit ribosomal protein S7
MVFKRKIKKPRHAYQPKAPVNKAKESKVNLPDMKLFGRWASDVKVQDPGLSHYVDLKPRIIPRSGGVYQKHRFHKSKMHIVERLALHMMVPGHTGKRHRMTSGTLAGGYMNVLSKMEKALIKVEEKTKKNPIEVLVKALENAAVTEEIMSYQMGSIMARDAVITSPQRRVDKTLRSFAQGAYKSSFRKKVKIEDALAKELISAYNNSNESFAVKERERVEAEASGAR